MILPRWRNRLRRGALLAASAVVLAAAPLRAAPDGAGPGDSAPAPHGVKHRIYVSARFEPASPQRRDDQAHATLTAMLQISDHARDANFFGTVLATFVDFAVSEEAPARLVWQDAQCHQERGAPKIIITALNGLVTGEAGETRISARPRHIGLQLPADELIPGQAVTFGRDQIGWFFAGHALTRQSRIQVDARVYTDECAPLAAEGGP